MIEEVKKQGQSNSSFEDIFLSVIQFLPPDQQGRAFSLFSVFRKQSPEQQKAIVDSLMSVAKEQTGPLYDLMKTRIEEDTTYAEAALNRQKNNALANYNRIVELTDINALRDKAKEDRSLAKTVRSITDNAFVTRVSGPGGIARRRTQEQLEAARLAKEDIDVAKNQKQTQAYQAFGQLEQEINARIAREQQMKERDLFDEEQKQMEANRSLFLSLFENEFSGLGDNARTNIESGDIPVDAEGPMNANIRDSESLFSAVAGAGGTDQERKVRYGEEVRVGNAKSEEERLNMIQGEVGKATSYILELAKYRGALRLAGRDTTEVDNEIARVRPIVESQIDRARSGQGAFLGTTGSGTPDLDWFLNNAADNYIYNDAGITGKYGSSPLDRTKLSESLHGFSSLNEQFGSSFNDVAYQDLRYVPNTNQLQNKYGSTEFNGTLAPAPSTPYVAPYSAPAPSVQPDVLAPVAGAMGKAGAQGYNPGTMSAPAKTTSSSTSQDALSPAAKIRLKRLSR